MESRQAGDYPLSGNYETINGRAYLDTGNSRRILLRSSRGLKSSILETGELDAIIPDVTYTFPLIVEVPATTPPGSYQGTVHVRENKRTVPDTLKVRIDVIEPSSSIVPIGVLLPSSDRIITDDEGRELVKDEIVLGLQFETVEPNARIMEIASTTGGAILGSVPEALTFQMQYETADLNSLEEIRLLLDALPDVEFAAHHYLLSESLAKTPDDSEYDDWDEVNPEGNNWHLEFIEAPSAWEINTGSSSVVVAVIDQDFDAEHSDLDDNVVQNVGPRTTKNGHGTHVSGLICAEGNNGQGVTGVSWDCSLRFYDHGGSTLRGLELMVQAVNENARIVNISGGVVNSAIPANDETLDALEEVNDILGRAILHALRESKDVLWVFAAGNESRDAKYQSPASLTGRFPLNTMTVAAIDDEAELATYSNFGDLVSVAAPGGEEEFLGIGGREIFSTIPRLCAPIFTDLCIDRYGELWGTSQATPQVAGLAALVLSEHPDFTASQVKECILAGATSDGVSVPGHSFRVINAPSAVRCEDELELPDKVDLVFSLDLTGSMGGELERIKTEIGDIITNLVAASPSTDFRFGVVSYEDYAGAFDSRPCGSSYVATYGVSGTKPGGDAPFRIDSSLTDDAAAVISSVSGLVLGFGADGPQSYGRVFWEVGQIDTGEALGFRADALKLLVNFADNVPHDTDLNQGIDSPPFATFDTGVDPGRNNTVDCNDDDIDFQDEALAALSTSEVRLLHIDSSENPSLAPYWQFWTSVTGGAFAAINSDGSIPGGLDLTELIINLLKLIE